MVNEDMLPREVQIRLAVLEQFLDEVMIDQSGYTKTKPDYQALLNSLQRRAKRLIKERSNQEE